MRGNSLYEKLKKYEASDFYGFHMPGHKRNTELMDRDCPMELILQRSMDLMICIMQTESCWSWSSVSQSFTGRIPSRILINGSTAGIMSAILGCVDRGGKLLVARNCHKSVYHAMELGGLELVYLYPEFDTTWEINGVIEPGTERMAGRF